MWHKAMLSIPQNMAALTCSVLPVHPWVYGLGQEAGEGSYLSPKNAAEHLASKLGTDDDEINVIVFMVCATSQADFMKNLAAFSSVLPLPVFSQVARRAQEVAQLAITKMQIPGKAVSGLPPAVPLSTATNRLAMNAQRIAQAKAEAATGASISGLVSAMSDFATARHEALAGVTQALADLQGKSTTAWVFTAKGSPAFIASEMRKNIPQQDAIFTLATLFSGPDLSLLEGMINDDHHAGA
ncbi:hypothetical protein EAH77_12680 [Ewingella americana]|uniref:Uncharacterized protein n=2 Tax=Ewingella americana TaxID=41202 RepID=A0A502GJJ8_9GAMM|nr:hypothetical protein EAH77_12680 [Ewingella americana]